MTRTRTPFVFSSTPLSRTTPSTLSAIGHSRGETVYVEPSQVRADGTLAPDDDREVYVYPRAESGRGVHVLASTLSPKPAELTVGQTVRVAARAGTAASGAGYVDPAIFGQLAEVERVSDEIVHVRSASGLHQGIHRNFVTPEPATLAAGKYRVTASPVFGALPLSVPTLRIGDDVTLEEGRGLPDSDGDVRVRTARGGLQWVRANVLSPIAEAPAPTLAERFPVGRKVVVGLRPKVADGSAVSPLFRGQVATVTRIVETWGGNVSVALSTGERNYISPDHLTLLPEGVELVKPTVREPLTFPAAYTKAASFRGQPTTAKQVAKTSKLAALLVEVSK